MDDHNTNLLTKPNRYESWKMHKIKTKVDTQQQIEDFCKSLKGHILKNGLDYEANIS